LQVLKDVGGAFGLSEGQRDALWRKVRARAGVEGLTFHDGRATAITRLSKKLELLQGRAPARPALVVPHILRELGIEPRDVLEYREKHGLRVTDPFWTTARVQDALRMGLS
jgi:uncharacterized protein with NRDE domain